ncbi:hypothetical protein D9M68_714010 [compost metagenome]
MPLTGFPNSGQGHLYFKQVAFGQKRPDPAAVLLFFTLQFFPENRLDITLFINIDDYLLDGIGRINKKFFVNILVLIRCLVVIFMVFYAKINKRNAFGIKGSLIALVGPVVPALFRVVMS